MCSRLPPSRWAFPARLPVLNSLALFPPPTICRVCKARNKWLRASDLECHHWADARPRALAHGLSLATTGLAKSGSLQLGSHKFWTVIVTIPRIALCPRLVRLADAWLTIRCALPDFQGFGNWRIGAGSCKPRIAFCSGCPAFALLRTVYHRRA